MILNSVLKGSRKLFPDQKKDRRGTEQRMLQKHRQNDREVTRIEEGCAHGFFCFFLSCCLLQIKFSPLLCVITLVIFHKV